MIKPLWAIAGVALLGTAGAAVAYVGSSGGEEEVVQQAATPASTTPAGTCIPAGPNGEVRCLSGEQLAASCPSGVQCGPPTPPYTCIYTVVGDETPCVPPTDPRVSGDSCPPIRFYDRAACLPEGANYFLVSEGGGAGINRGHSIIRWGEKGAFEYYVAPEDEADFQALRELFLPGGATPRPGPYPYRCRYIVTNGELACLPLDNPLVRACTAIDFQDRSACAPEGTEFGTEWEEFYDPSVADTVTKTYTVIKRGNSLIKYHPFDNEPIEYRVTAEDEANFKGLEALFETARAQ